MSKRKPCATPGCSSLRKRGRRYCEDCLRDHADEERTYASGKAEWLGRRPMEPWRISERVATNEEWGK